MFPMVAFPMVLFYLALAGCRTTGLTPPAGSPGEDPAAGNREWRKAGWTYKSGNTWSSPFQVHIQVAREGVDAGKDVEVSVFIFNITSSITSSPSSSESPGIFTITDYRPTVSIFPPSGSISSPVWEETLPPFRGILGPGEGYEFKFSWGQVDSWGKQVPPGRYYVELKPSTIRYVARDGLEREQFVEWSPHTSHAEALINQPEGAWDFLIDLDPRRLETPGKAINAENPRPTNPGKQFVPVLVYHHLAPKALGLHKTNGAIITVEEFEAQMWFLKEQGYHTATTAELAAWLEGEKRLPPRTVVVTFDDGYETLCVVQAPRTTDKWCREETCSWRRKLAYVSVIIELRA